MTSAEASAPAPAETPEGTRPDRGLDWLNLLLAAAGAAHGAFIPVYLTSKAWTQTQIGLVLTVGTVTAVLPQGREGGFPGHSEDA